MVVYKEAAIARDETRRGSERVGAEEGERSKGKWHVARGHQVWDTQSVSNHV